MKDIKNLTPTELLKHIHDLKTHHESLKDIIIQKTVDIESIEKEINSKLVELKAAEVNYVKAVEEMENR
jgi:hypothetical protein